MKTIMLGDVVRKLEALPSEMLGVIFDLLEKLLGVERKGWFAALKRFLRKEPCWSTAWQNLFSHLEARYNFSEANYPLEPESAKAVVEYGFDTTISGFDAAYRFKQMGYSLPGPRACGKYIKDHPRAQFEHLLVGIGAVRRRSLYVPVFYSDGVKPTVLLQSQDYEFDISYRFLVSPPVGDLRSLDNLSSR